MCVSWPSTSTSNVPPYTCRAPHHRHLLLLLLLPLLFLLLRLLHLPLAPPLPQPLASLRRRHSLPPFPFPLTQCRILPSPPTFARSATTTPTTPPTCPSSLSTSTSLSPLSDPHPSSTSLPPSPRPALPSPLGQTLPPLASGNVCSPVCLSVFPCQSATTSLLHHISPPAKLRS